MTSSCGVSSPSVSFVTSHHLTQETKTSPNVIYIIAFFDCLIWGIYAPVLPLFHREHDISVKMTGLYTSAMSLLPLFSSPILGNLSDKYGRRAHFFQIGSLFNIIGMVMCLFASDGIQFMAGRIMQAVFRVSNILIQVCLSENCTRVQMGNRFATLAAVQAIAFVIGPVVGGQLADQDRRLPMITSCLLCICNIFVQFFVRSEHIPFPKSTKIDDDDDDDDVDKCANSSICCILEGKSKEGGIYESTNKSSSMKEWLTSEFVFVFHVKMFFTFANSIYETIFAQYMLSQLHLEGSSIGWMLGYVGLATTFANAFVVKTYSLLIQRHYSALIYAAVLHAIGLVLWATTPVIQFSMLASALIALTNQIVTNYLQTTIVLKTNPGNKGEILGYSQSIERAARALAPFVGGFAYQQYGVQGVAVAGALPSIYCAVTLLLYPPQDAALVVEEKKRK